jgi:hypothetical protein
LLINNLPDDCGNNNIWSKLMDVEIEHLDKGENSKNNDYITDEERQHLISGLHRLLVWVGEPLPDMLYIDDKILKIHETIWQCIHNEDITEEEKHSLGEIARLLEKKEKDYEEALQTANLTHEDADKLYHEIASIIRAITDIKECEAGKVNLKEHDKDGSQRIDDAKRWISFLKTVRKK